MPFTDDELTNWFTYHDASPEQQEKFLRIRAAALSFAKVINDNAPDSADKTAAIRKIRESMFTANASISCAP